MAWAAFRAPGARCKASATKRGGGSPGRSGNVADGPPPPEPEGREGLAADIRVAKTLGGEPTPPLGLRALISAAIPSRATHAI